MQMVRGNGGNQFRQYVGKNVGNQNGYNAVQNAGNQVVKNAVQNPGIQNGLIVVPGIANQNANQNGNGNVVAARAEGNGNGNNGNQVRCYNCRGMGHFARNYTVRPRRRDTIYLQTQLLTTQKEEAGIQLQAEEFDLMATTRDLDDIEKMDQLSKRADESLAKHKALEYEIEHLLRAVVSHDIMSIMQINSCRYINLQTGLDHMKEKLETCMIKKEKEYVVLWNNWYKKCEECKYDMTSYDKAYNNMQQKIERLQAQLGDLKGKSQDTPCVLDTLDPLSQKLEDENVSLEFQVLNYAK
ncbi:retrovirus-related pol polyprotein from transposon TNT 1-94 [Tanacetum coccineum]